MARRAHRSEEEEEEEDKVCEPPNGSSQAPAESSPWIQGL